MTASLARRRAHEAGQVMLMVDGANNLAILTNDWSDLDPTASTKLCRMCERILPVHCFALDKRSRSGAQTWHPDCIICETELRKDRAERVMFRKKADAALRSHMVRENEQGLHRCRTFEDYQLLTGVTVNYVEQLMREAYERNTSCDHCESRGHEAQWQVICRVGEDGVPDLHDMTLDRVDRKRLLSKDNIRLLCRFGNIGRTDDPHIDAVREAYWRRYNATRSVPA